MLVSITQMDERAWYERETIPHILIAEDQGRRALIVDGAVQSVAPEAGHLGSGYWTAMIPSVRPQRVLLLGLGAGTVAHLLTQRFGPVPIVAIDNDIEVVEIARAEFGLDLPNVTIEIDDAFAYVNAAVSRYDLILVDLYRGPLPAPGMTSRPFLKGLRRILLPRGQVVFNCFQAYLTSHRVRNLHSVFRVTSVVPAGSNRVVFCR